MSHEFDFDPDHTPDENIEAFYRHFAGKNPELTEVLRAAMEAMLPLPESGAPRTAKRTAANTGVLAALEPSGSERE